MATRSLKAGLLGFTAICAAALVDTPARAQDASSQINAIERQIRALQGQLNHMKQDLSARSAEVKAARREAAEASRQAREASERYRPTRYDGNGRPLAPPPLAAPPGFGAAELAASNQSPFINTRGNPGFTPSGPALKQGQFALGPVRVTLGGFVEAAGIFRSRNENADISSSFASGIPLPQTAGYHQDEFRGTARQSRISLLVEGNPNTNTTLSAYYETDFNSAGVTSNSTESNSYTLRTRVLNAEYSRKDADFFILAGQTWSLLTQTKVGLSPRTEDLPATIDAQYAVGFVWTRNVGVRIVKGFDHDKFDIGLSVESPQDTYAQTGYPAGPTLNVTNNGTASGGATLNSSATYSTEFAPDIIAKASADPGYGHYEVFGVARFLHDRVENVGTGTSKTKLAGGGGAGLLVPVVPKLVDFRLSGLIGDGIGRYGSAQLNDATIARDGGPQPLPEVIALAGLTLHATKALDLYGLAGTETILHRESYSITNGKTVTNFGYGNPNYVNTGCNIELSPLVCTANTRSIVQGVGGFWWKFLKGDYGTMQVGLQDSYTRKFVFRGVGGSPNTNDNIVLASLRYYPFQ